MFLYISVQPNVQRHLKGCNLTSFVCFECINLISDFLCHSFLDIEAMWVFHLIWTVSSKCQKSNNQRCSVKKMFLEILKNSQVNNSETLVQVFSCEFCEIFKNTFLQNISGRLFLKHQGFFAKTVNFF